MDRARLVFWVGVDNTRLDSDRAMKHLVEQWGRTIPRGHKDEGAAPTAPSQEGVRPLRQSRTSSS